MKMTQISYLSVKLLTAAVLLRFTALAQTEADPGWPRVIQKDGKQLTVYQPQVDYWKDFAENELRPPQQAITITLDRVLAYLEPTEQPTQHPVERNLEPPKIFYSRQPAMLVMFLGEPQFKPIETTTIQYAVNSPYAVFLAGGSYYCCNRDVWYVSTAAAGPWRFCTSVPPALYTIPPSHPYYHVTYVVVQSSTPATVVYSQTAGYSGQYVAANGVLMVGMGMLVGAAVADQHDHDCYPPPSHYSYGCGEDRYRGWRRLLADGKQPGQSRQAFFG
jgi:hypothetical protein